MFLFNPAKMQLRYELVTAITEALGGSIRFVDQDEWFQSKMDPNAKKATSVRHPLPYAVARAVKKANGGRSEFLNPVMMAIVTYEGVIVHVERATVVQGTSTLYSVSERAMGIIRDTVANTEKGKWYTDGNIIYQIPHNPTKTTADTTYMTSDKRFFALSCNAFKFTDMHDLKLLGLFHTRSIVGFITSNKKVVFTPPLWKNVLELRTKGASGVKNTTSSESTDTSTPTEPTYRFDVLNKEFLVNLEFVLNVADVIGENFGYEEISYLRIEDYVIDLCAISLPLVDKSIRSTYDTKMTFVNCMAWLLGFVARCPNLQVYAQLTQAMKVLCKNGISNRDHIDKALNIAPPPVMSREEALTKVYEDTDTNIIGHYWSTNGDWKKRGEINSAAVVLGQID